jgi:Rod binding domain-containing protein
MQIQPVKPPPDRTTDLRAKAEALETAFLSQMLANAGFDTALAGMGGGDGAGQFASFLREERAAAIVRAGGIGLAEAFLRSLEARDG